MSNNKNLENNTIQDLKQKYSVLKDCRTNIVSLQDNITVKIQKLNAIYEELIKFNKATLFVIGLDTFHFQKTLLNIEYETLNTYFNMISNRIYCDYYKMYKIIQKYVIDNINENKILDLFKTFSNYPVYDNLNIHRIYSFENITNIFSDIVDILLSMNEYCNNQHIILKNYKIKQNYGLNINNFVFTFENQVIDLVNKVDLFNKYMHFFVSIHYKYFSKYLTKIKLMYTQINHDIKLDETFNTSKQTSDKLIEELTYQTDNDITIINQIKDDIISEDSNRNNTPKLSRLQSVNTIKLSQSIPETIVEESTINIPLEIKKSETINLHVIEKTDKLVEEVKNIIDTFGKRDNVENIDSFENIETVENIDKIENNEIAIELPIKNIDKLTEESNFEIYSETSQSISCISDCPNKTPRENKKNDILEKPNDKKTDELIVKTKNETIADEINNHSNDIYSEQENNEIKLNINVSSDELEATINNLESQSIISEQSTDTILSEQHQNNISLVVKPKRKYTKRKK